MAIPEAATVHGPVAPDGGAENAAHLTAATDTAARAAETLPLASS